MRLEVIRCYSSRDLSRGFICGNKTCVIVLYDAINPRQRDDDAADWGVVDVLIHPNTIVIGPLIGGLNRQTQELRKPLKVVVYCKLTKSNPNKNTVTLRIVTLRLTKLFERRSFLKILHYIIAYLYFHSLEIGKVLLLYFALIVETL